MCLRMLFYVASLQPKNKKNIVQCDMVKKIFMIGNLININKKIIILLSISESIEENGIKII